MKSSGLTFYFILYLVAIVTVFAITVERDQVLDERDEVIEHLISVYVKPLALSSFVDTARFFIEPNQTFTRDSIRVKLIVEGPIEKKAIVFTLLEAKRWQSEGNFQGEEITGVVRNEEGEGVLLYPPLEAGIYEFKVSAYKKRIASRRNQMSVTIGDTTYAIPYSESLERIDRDTTVLIAKVEKSGVIPPQLTLSVQEARENWVLGPDYRKKIFVSGVGTVQGVSFAAGRPGGIETVTGVGSYVHFLWEKPTLGKRTFTVTANANRGFGEKDRSSVTFDVEVLPATFVSSPSSKGFWGIPYLFNGQVVGVNPLDLSVQVFHDGKSLGMKPVVRKLSLLPDRNWNSTCSTKPTKALTRSITGRSSTPAGTTRTTRSSRLQRKRA